MYGKTNPRAINNIYSSKLGLLQLNNYFPISVLEHNSIQVQEKNVFCPVSLSLLLEGIMVSFSDCFCLMTLYECSGDGLKKSL